MKIAYLKTGRFALLAGAFLIASACASTKVTSDWKEGSYQKKPSNILVLALTNDMTQRRLMEDELVSRMKSAGISAVPGYTVLPGAMPADREVIAAKVKELGADAVFTTRLVDRKTVQEHVPGTAYYPPPAYHNLYTYYDGLYPPGFAYPPGYGAGGGPAYPPPAYSPGYTRETVYNIAEANLYDGATGELVWSARTESEMRGNDRKAIQSYASKIMKSLKKQGLVG